MAITNKKYFSPVLKKIWSEMVGGILFGEFRREWTSVYAIWKLAEPASKHKPTAYESYIEASVIEKIEWKKWEKILNEKKNSTDVWEVVLSSSSRTYDYVN